tara:strand:+ start:4321 stop:5325 length:1005 start_codon:yes stop_codon:yes gene_type:complete
MSKFSDKEKIDLLIKKRFGKPSTDINLKHYSEPDFNARPFIFANKQIYSEKIPPACPTDFDTVKEDGFKSTLHPHIIKYEKKQMESATPGNNKSFKGPAVGDITNILQQCIPFNYDPMGSYSIELYDNNNNPIDDCTGEWVVDTDAGILTFYEYNDVNNIVSSTKSPKITFYRYSGNIGLSSISGLFSNNSAEDGINYSTIDKTVLLGKSTKHYSPDSGQTNLEVNGDIYASSLYATSDKRLKKNIKKIEYPIEKVKQLNGVSFDWRKTNEPSSGIIAQDLEKIMPEAVINGINNIKSVNYSSIIGLLVETVKEMNLKYDNLEYKFNELNKKLN